MAIVGKAIRQRQAADAEHERLQAMLKRDYGPYVEVPFEWQRKQTPRAVQFPTYGWVPASLIRCRKADGKLYGWDQYREGDAFLLPQWVLEGIGAA